MKGIREGRERRNLHAVMLPDQQGPGLHCDKTHRRNQRFGPDPHRSREQTDKPWACCERMGEGTDRDTLAIEQRTQSNLYRKLLVVLVSGGLVCLLSSLLITEVPSVILQF